ncbi:MAG TPA: heme lyase CcmF/NrfE family subunit [Acidimicrobiia bacterium]
MIAPLGYLALTVGMAGAISGISILAVGLRRHDTRLLRLGRVTVFVVLGAAVAAVAVMEWALITHDFSIKYVADNNARSTPLLFTITGLWAALEGSILLWVLILAGYLTAVAVKFRARVTDPLVAWATLTGLAVAAFFFALTLFAANPFTLTPGGAPVDGQGPNPLLQNHPLMAFHPPMLYLGYVGFTVPFAFAIAALVTGRFGEGWLADTRRATLVAWGFLTVGIILGAWWSYEVLGWGGYWAWDPVENASLLPWLTGTAFIHSVIVQERRGMLRVWNLSLIIATFCLTILGTFLTRSGVIDSVHAFTQSDIGPWLLTFLAVVAAVGVGLIAWRGDRLRAPGRIDSPVSRESAFLFNNLLFAGLALVVLLGTVFPLVAEALQGRRLSVGEPYFDRMTVPLGLALLFIMAAAPALPWRATSSDVLRRRLVFPAWAGGLAMLVAVVLGVRSLTMLLTFGLAAFAIGGIVRQFYIGVRARLGASGERAPGALTGMVRGNPRLYGGLVVHLGVVLIAVALAASSGYGAKREVRLRVGQSATVDGYRVTYLGSTRAVTGQKTTVKARVRIERGGDNLGTYAPAISTFPNSTEGIGTPSVHTGALRDVYLTLVSSPNQRGRVTIGVLVNPMVVWIWIGGGVMALGTLIALAPTMRARLRRDPRRGRLASDPDGGPVAAEVREVEPV